LFRAMFKPESPFAVALEYPLTFPRTRSVSNDLTMRILGIMLTVSILCSTLLMVLTIICRILLLDRDVGVIGWLIRRLSVIDGLPAAKTCASLNLSQ
jgi:hypothetical protein